MSRLKSPPLSYGRAYQLTRDFYRRIERLMPRGVNLGAFLSAVKSRRAIDDCDFRTAIARMARVIRAQRRL